MSLPFTPRDAFSVMGAKHALGIPKSGSDEQRPVEFYSRQEVADAELASRARWARRGSTRQERILSVKKELLGLIGGGAQTPHPRVAPYRDEPSPASDASDDPGQAGTTDSDTVREGFDSLDPGTLVERALAHAS